MKAATAIVLLLAGCADHVVEAVHQGGTPPVFEGCPVLAASSAWNQDVLTASVDPRSTDYLSSIGLTASLRADFGTSAEFGLPWTVVPGSQPKVPVTFSYADESDTGPYPIPEDVAIEGGADATGNRHALIVQTETCVLHELSRVTRSGGAWQAEAGAIWPLREDRRRPLYFTSADAAGLPMFPGLVRYDEVAAGEIRHALRFSAPSTQRAFVAPATHYASTSTDPALPPMGLRLRLKASVDVAAFPAATQVILRALQRHGMFLAENGSALFLSGGPDVRWDETALAALQQIHGSDFEAIATGPLTY